MFVLKKLELEQSQGRSLRKPSSFYQPDVKVDKINDKLAVISGFAHSGKTTALCRHAMYHLDQDKPVILVSNEDRYESIHMKFKRDGKHINDYKKFIILTNVDIPYKVDEDVIIIIDNISLYKDFNKFKTIEDFIESIGLSNNTVVCSANRNRPSQS